MKKTHKERVHQLLGSREFVSVFLQFMKKGLKLMPTETSLERFGEQDLVFIN